MNRPAYSPDLVPYDFFLFGAMKGNTSGMRFGSVDELFQVVEDFLRELSVDTLQTAVVE
jgi:hypothetical protein